MTPGWRPIITTPDGRQYATGRPWYSQPSPWTQPVGTRFTLIGAPSPRRGTPVGTFFGYADTGTVFTLAGAQLAPGGYQGPRASGSPETAYLGLPLPGPAPSGPWAAGS